MAIEFGSRRETFENYKVYETMLAGRPFKVEMGKMCGLSNASAHDPLRRDLRSVQCGHEPQAPRRRGFLPAERGV